MVHLFKYLKERADVADCCKTAENLDVKDQGNKVYLATCKRCGRRHFLAQAEPTQFGLSVRDLTRARGEDPNHRKIILPK